MTETLLLTRREVAELRPMSDCIGALEGAFRAQAAGRALPSGVLGLHAPAGAFHVKAAGLRLSRLYVAAKINANFPGNPERHGLPTIQGIVALYDGEDGRPLAVMDSIEITALRTGAATAVAAKSMASRTARSLAVCGCGTQAAYQVRAVAAVRPIAQVRVYDRDPERAQSLAARLSAELGLSASPLRSQRDHMNRLCRGHRVGDDLGNATIEGGERSLLADGERQQVRICHLPVPHELVSRNVSRGNDGDLVGPELMSR